MRLDGKVEAHDVDDVRRMVRSRWYWPRLVLSNLYGTMLLILLLWATIEMLLKREGNWLAMAGVWLVMVAIIGWAFFRAKREIKRENTRLQDQLPDWITLANDGVRIEGPHGASGFQPWVNYKSWREGKRVWLVYRSRGDGFLILPVASISETERQTLRGILQSSITTHA